MEHPFEVGNRYRNRQGEYEVLSLDGPRMVIRYTNGSVLQTTVAVQARIWQNIQLEARLEREAERAASEPRLRRRGGRRGLDFQGLQDHDFQEGVAGTSWRARTSLGGRLAQRLTDTTPYFFQSYAIYRQAQVHIAQPTHYDPKTRLQQAKFVFGLRAEGAWYGFYIEKNDGPMDETWHWPNLMEALSADAQLAKEVEMAMRKHDLHWRVCVWADGGLIVQVRTGEEGLLRETSGQEESQPLSWAEFVDQLRDIDVEKWCDLYLTADLQKEKAMDAGAGLVDPVAEVYRALLPLYEASTLQGRFGGSGA